MSLKPFLKTPIGIFILCAFFSNRTIGQNDHSTSEYEDHIEKAWEWFEDQNYEEALNEFRRAVDITPEGVDAYFGLATCHLILGQFDEAEQALPYFLNTETQRADLFFLAGNIYFQQQNYLASITHYDLALDYNDGTYQVNEMDLYFNRGNAKLILEQNEAALEDFKKAMNQGDYSAEIYLKYAIGLHRVGSQYKACRFYEQARLLDESNSEQELFEYCFDYFESFDTLNTRHHKHSEDTAQIFDKVEKNASPKDGMASFYRFIGMNMIYPLEAKRLGVKGRVFIQFIVNQDGCISDVRPIKGIGGGCDEEAVRVIRNAPPWEPSYVDGKPVRTRMIMPITFKQD